MNWFKKDKYQNIRKNNESINWLLDFRLIEYSRPSVYEIEYLEMYPEIPKRPHQTPEFRFYIANLLQQHNLVELEDIKEDEETPSEVKERRKLEKKNQ